MFRSNISATMPFEACFVWKAEGQIVTLYKVEPEIERADGSVLGRLVEFIQCRIVGVEGGAIHYDLDSIKSPYIRDQVQRLIGQSLDIPWAVRVGAPMYIESPHVGLKLNKISDQLAERKIQDYFQSIPRLLVKLRAKLEAPEYGAESLEYLLEKLAETNFELGALFYQQEAQKGEIVSHLGSAGKYYVKFLSMRDEPRELLSRFVGDFEKTVDLVVCFGERELRRELAGIERWQYYFPEDDAYRTRADYLEVEKRFVAEGVLNEAELRRLEEFCTSDKAPKEEKEFLLPKMRGLKALVNGDKAALNRAITDLIEAHKLEALGGEYRLMCDGLICLPGMMLAQLGRERNMTVTVKSDYLPLLLLE